MSGFISFLNIICIEGKLDGDVDSNAIELNWMGVLIDLC